MKCVYVITSDNYDNYFEQLIISIKSLILYNNNCEVIVLTDKITADKISSNRKVIYQLAEIVMVEVPFFLRKNQKAKYMKTQIYKYINDNCVYIDSDTIICDSLMELEDKNKDIYAVLDKHYLLSTHPSKRNIYNRAKKCHCVAEYDDKHYNSGLIVINKTNRTKIFFEKWENLYLKYIKEYKVDTDQVSFNEVNYEMNGIICELSGEWNCQMAHRTKAMHYFYNAKIIHYFASYDYKSVPFDFSDKKLLQSIYDSDVIDQMIHNPKTALKCVEVLESNNTEIIISESYSIRLLCSIYNNCRPLFNIQEWIFGFVYKGINKLGRILR